MSGNGETEMSQHAALHATSVVGQLLLLPLYALFASEIDSNFHMSSLSLQMFYVTYVRAQVSFFQLKVSSSSFRNRFLKASVQVHKEISQIFLKIVIGQLRIHS